MFSLKLKEVREERGLSQQALAIKLNISQSTVGMWESGKREPNFETTNQIANLFDVSTDYLLGRTERQPVPSFSALELQLINNFRLLNEEGQEKLLDHSIDLVSSGRYIKSNEPKMVSKKA